MRTLLTALTALMLFATPVVAGDWEDGGAAFNASNYEKAFRLLKPFAEQGHAAVQAILGYMYTTGNGVPKDDAKAVYWYLKAAEQGNAKAQANFGGLYGQGVGVPKDAAKEVYWYRKAAEQGVAQAQGNLGAMYHNGVGVPEDYVQAYAWSSIAAAQGRGMAKENKGEVKKVMTREQIAKGQELAAEYWKKYVLPFQEN